MFKQLILLADNPEPAGCFSSFGPPWQFLAGNSGVNLGNACFNLEKWQTGNPVLPMYKVTLSVKLCAERKFSHRWGNLFPNSSMSFALTQKNRDLSSLYDRFLWVNLCQQWFSSQRIGLQRHSGVRKSYDCWLQLPSVTMNVYCTKIYRFDIIHNKTFFLNLTIL